jgi:DnaJ-domain-containing protein 1
MENLEDKFRFLEIDEELQKLKQELGNPSSPSGKAHTTSQSNREYTPPRNSEYNQPTNDEKRTRFYAILGLKPDASMKEVKQAYKNLVKRCHPDLFFDNPQLQQKAHEVLIKINEAYEEFCSQTRD